MKKVKKILALMLSVLMLVSVLAACSGGTEDTGTNDKSTTTDKKDTSSDKKDTSGKDTAPTADPKTWTEADATETLNILCSASINTLNRWIGTNNNTLTNISSLIFDPLLLTDEDGTVKPWLATEWEMADDYSYVSFKLRDDVYFSNGKQLTADDMIFTFERIRDDEEHIPASVGKAWRTYLGEIEKNGDFEFTLHFKATMPEFWSVVTGVGNQFICKSVYEELGEAYFDLPIGTGPYVITKWDSANCVADLEIRTDEHGYWGYDYTGNTTNVKYVHISLSPEANTRSSAMLSGEADIIDTVSTTDRATLESAGKQIAVMPPVNEVFLQLACDNGDIMNNTELCKALSLSLDRQLIVDSILDGYAVPCDNMFQPTDIGYDKSLAVEYSKEKAIEAVKASGYNGEPIDFIFTTAIVNVGVELSQAIQSMASEVGIDLQIRMLENAIYNDARGNHDFDVCLACISNSGNSWYKIFAEVIGTDRFHSQFTNTELKDLGIKLGTEMSQQKQAEIYQAMSNILLTDYRPIQPLYWPTIIHAYGGDVSGVLNHNSQVIDARFVNISK